MRLAARVRRIESSLHQLAQTIAQSAKHAKVKRDRAFWRWISRLGALVGISSIVVSFFAIWTSDAALKKLRNDTDIIVRYVSFSMARSGGPNLRWVSSAAELRDSLKSVFESDTRQRAIDTSQLAQTDRLYFRAIAYRQLGWKDSSEAYLRRAVDADTANATALASLGLTVAESALVLESVKMMREAVARWREAFSFYDRALAHKDRLSPEDQRKVRNWRDLGREHFVELDTLRASGN